MPNYLSPGVYVEEVPAGVMPIQGVGTAVCAFVGMAEKGPVNQPTMVTNWTQFVTSFGEFIEGSYLAHAVYGYFLNGGSSAYVVRIGADDDAAAPAARLEVPGREDKPGFRVLALEGGAAGDGIAVEVQEPSEPGEDVFKLVVSRPGSDAEVYDNVTLKRGPQGLAQRVRQSKLVKIEEAGTGGAVAPITGKWTLSGGSTSVSTRVRPDDYVGSSADRTGFMGLESIEEITMLTVPDLMAAYQRGAIDMEGLKAVQLAMIAHCELMGDRVAILDAPPGLNAQQVKEWRMEKAGYDSKYAALYWPWIKVFDPARGAAAFIPPSGHMGGIWARSDSERGVHKAPANEVIRGVLSLELQITRGEQDQLNPIGVNCLRSFPGRGIRVWGARTLSTTDPSWRYLNVRRLFNYIEGSILGGTQWVVFEPNDRELWARVRRTITAFLVQVWRDGALFGGSPGEAFYVKCDDENNTAESIDAGQLIVEIGVAPVKPAEFVIFRLAQFSGGASLAE